METLNKMRFKGTFRDYQQRVLDKTEKYLKDGKINIVAAPGSGKTVLGLEIIRRAGSPCIIFSPTTAIRRQWGSRFKEMFLDNPDDYRTLFSENLHDIKIINSVTYQALYTAVEKVSASDDDDADCSDVDIFAEIKDFGIKTICLDEAHHLKNEWQKALEKFISALDKDVKIISLTATPPYDSDLSEWNRYVKICGEIDEEIFVPELVGRNTLCPHQDYIYFNYPSKEEISNFQKHKENALFTLDVLSKNDIFRKLSDNLNGEKDYDKLFSSVKEYVALCVLLKYFGYESDKRLIKALTAKRGLPKFKMSYAETALQFLLDGDLITQEEKTEIINILKSNSVYEKKKVALDLNEKLKRSLISSVGKLESIKTIVSSEIINLGDKLRMLILTDYIKKESLSNVAFENQFNSVNIVSIFESVRRGCPDAKIGVLSGSLVILPEFIDLSGEKCKTEEIQDTEYNVVEFQGNTHRSVDFVGKLFEQGKIQILIGTKSLLGEGWDSPCINSLIMASFVGSFVLSNQMRGRAIRIDKNDPDKTANIWHLVTIEPEYLFKEKLSERVSEYLNEDYTEIHSYDYDIMKRRFDTFMGPDYTSGVIESGIERIKAIKPPFNKNGIEKINAEMLFLAANRAAVKQKWNNEVSSGSFAVSSEINVPKEEKVPVFTFWNAFFCVLLLAAQTSLLGTTVNAIVVKQNPAVGLVCVLITLALCPSVYKFAKMIVSHINPVKSIKTLGKAVYKTLCECDLISPSAKVETLIDKDTFSVTVQLRNASVHDQNVFNAAMTEMLSPIENPRYILIAKGFCNIYNYTLSFACPSVIGKKKEYVEILAEQLKNSTGKFQPVYAHSEDGRSLILKCRKRSYISLNERAIRKGYKVSHWE